MAAGKRKVVDTTAAQPSKKSKKSTKTVSSSEAVTAAAAPISEEVAPAVIKTKTTENVVVAEKPSKKTTRKRAADFMTDDAPQEDSPKPKKGKKEAKAQKEVVEAKSLTADGVNGVVEHSEDEGITITTTKQPKKKSMMAEAERTQDAELAEEYGSDDDGEDVDTAPALLAGFDSDNEDPAEDKNFDGSRVQPIPQFKKTSKKLRQAKEKKSDGPGVVYIGRVPHGFYEAQMREYFTQFGNITRLRLSRNKKTGASKHFAFVEFESDEVAKIVADTMDNYLMFGHILKCKYAPAESLHADVWKGANKKYRKIPQHKLLKQQAEQPKTDEQIEKKMKKVQGKREKKAKQLAEMGYEYELPTLVKPTTQAPAAVENGSADKIDFEDKVEGALVPPPTVPKDEVAVKVEEKQKKAKKEKAKKNQADIPSAQASENPTSIVADVSVKPKKAGKKDNPVVPAEVVEAIPVVTEEIVAIEAPKATKAKKGKKEPAAEIPPIVAEEITVAAVKPAKKGKKGKNEDIPVETAPVVVEITTITEETVPKKGKKGKKDTITAVESAPAITEETVVIAEDAAPKKSKKSKKDTTVESAPVVVEEISAVVVEDAPKKGKKAKKDVAEVPTNGDKAEKKQLKGILKKTKKA